MSVHALAIAATLALAAAPPGEPSLRAPGPRALRGRVVGASGPEAGVEVVASRVLGADALIEAACTRPADLGPGDRGCLDEPLAAPLRAALERRRAEDARLPRALSRADGTFEIAGLAEGVYALWATGKAGAALPARARAGSEVVLRLTPPGPLEGSISREGGAPAAGAAVLAIHASLGRVFSAVADAQGRFAVAAPRGEYCLLASSPATLSGQRGAGAPRDLELSTRRKIEGQVTSTNGGAQARVEVGFGGARYLLGPADAAGRFVVPGACPGEHVLRATHYGSIGEATVRVGADVERVELPVVPGCWAVGVVRDGTGRPLANARVAGQSASATTGRDGRYSVGPLDLAENWMSRRYEAVLEASAPGFVPRRATPGFPDARQRQIVQDFDLEPDAQLSGVVVGPDGLPVPGAAVELDSPRRSTRTDAAGAFSFPGLLAGGRWLTVRSPEHPPLAQAVDAAAGLRIELARGVALEGAVVDAAGAPLAGVDVRLTSEIGAPIVDARSTRSAFDGSFSFAGLASGQAYRVAAWQLGATSRRVEARLEPQGEHVSLEIKFPAGVRLQGRILDAAGTPIAGAVVHLDPRGDSECPSYASTRTGPDGSLAVADLTPGAYTLRVVRAGSRPGELPITVGPTTDPVTFTLEPSGQLH